MEKFIVVFREHGQLFCDTVYYGPFDTHEDAYDYLSSLPALGADETERPGVKFVQQLTPHGVRYGFGEQAPKPEARID